MAIIFPDIDPVAISLWKFSVRWYALAYIFGILVAYFVFRKLNKGLLSNDAIETLFAYSIIGILFGGRLGYMLFYNFEYYLENPLESLKLWNGGMSFHGGLIGVFLAILFISYKERISMLYIADRLTSGASAGIFFGRIANFINGELFGRITDVSWGIIFPYGGEFPRHPSQLYEALSEGLILFLLVSWLSFFTRALKFPGFVMGVWVFVYALSRIVIEFYRQPDPQLGFIWSDLFTLGQLLSLPMFIAGIIIICLFILNNRRSL